MERTTGSEGLDTGELAPVSMVQEQGLDGTKQGNEKGEREQGRRAEDLVCPWKLLHLVFQQLNHQH